ncbi:MAG: SDR family oxidoreductase [Planctomycetota bacterium]|jgi:NAD(P)-dependent dehydrogenase (short-subunit alcohol dehydrogenase family)|nr:SDR family oxidoreductase [Planctomycetota bacterium]
MYDGFSLKDKNAIITGATRGIGLAIAQGFLESGATVTLCGRKQEGIDEALETLGEHTDSVQGISAHVGQPDDLERLVDQAGSRFGNVNVLVNNAGTNPYYGPIVDSEDWAWDKTMEVNLKGPYMLSKRVARKMIDAGSGSIVNIASVAGLSSFEEQGIYSTSKAGLIMLTKVLARELGSAGVRANCICPGVIKTRLSRALWEDEAEQESASLKALGRVGETGEIVGAAIYFASDASSFTTGSVLQIDGGMVI